MSDLERWRRFLQGSIGLALLLAAVGCSGGSSSAESTSCPNVAGTWTLTKHCDPTAVGLNITVEQSGCALTVVFKSDNETNLFTGTVKNDGSVVTTGTVNGETMTCTGAFSGASLSESCSVPSGDIISCDVDATKADGT